MAIRAITTYGMPVLRRRADSVRAVSEIEPALLRDMIDTMRHAHGVGLAAPQVGVSLAIFVSVNPMSADDSPRGQELILINPRIVRQWGSSVEEEGCLSVPGYSAPVKRFRHAVLQAQDRQGRLVEIEASALLARIFQHECDHLQGRLFLDRLPFLARRKALRVIRLNMATHYPVVLA